MDRFLRWAFLRYVRLAVRQGYHDQRIERLFFDIAVAAENEFTEDNVPTLRAYLEERFEVAMEKWDARGAKGGE